MAKAPSSRYLDTVGDGSGVKNSVVNGSVTPVIFRIKPGAGETIIVNRLIISMVSSSNSLNIGYGGAATALPNGIELKVITGGAGGSTVWDITDGIPITQNHDWKNLCFDENYRIYGATNSQVSYRYTFTNDDGSVELSGDNSDELQVIINDNLTTGYNLLEQYFRAGMEITF